MFDLNFFSLFRSFSSCSIDKKCDRGNTRNMHSCRICSGFINNNTKQLNKLIKQKRIREFKLSYRKSVYGDNTAGLRWRRWRRLWFVYIFIGCHLVRSIIVRFARYLIVDIFWKRKISHWEDHENKKWQRNVPVDRLLALFKCGGWNVLNVAWFWYKLSIFCRLFSKLE